jgi:CheY-like chemotaxis protein
MKRAEETSSIPLVAIAAAVMPEDRARAQNLGFTEFLAKPIEPREVLACVDRLLAT